MVESMRSVPPDSAKRPAPTGRTRRSIGHLQIHRRFLRPDRTSAYPEARYQPASEQIAQLLAEAQPLNVEVVAEDARLQQRALASSSWDQFYTAQECHADIYENVHSWARDVPNLTYAADLTTFAYGIVGELGRSKLLPPWHR